jgi:hypothetical protein
MADKSNSVMNAVQTEGNKKRISKFDRALDKLKKVV